MSGGFAAVVHFDNRPVDSRLLATLTEKVAHRGPDAQGIWEGPGAGIGFCSFWTVPEAVGESGPVVAAASGLVLAADGRIDNRDEILERLGSAATASLGPNPSDAVIFLAAFRAQGLDVFAHILGDFAVVIWDSRNRELLLVRDRLAMRPLYYAEIPNGVVVASEIRAILAHPDVDPAWNPDMIAATLTEVPEPAWHTLYKNIYKVRHCHALRWNQRARDLIRYWQPRLDLIRYPRHEDYAEHFLAEVQRSVRAMLRCHGKAGTYLSGGLDSSTVTALAQSLSSPPPQAYSIVFPGSLSDESFYIRASEQHLGITSKKIAFRSPPAGFVDQRIDFFQDMTAYSNFGPLFYATEQAALQDGVRVLLTGYGGNAVMESYSIANGEALLSLRISDLIDDFRHSTLSAGEWFSHLKRPWLRPVAPIPEWARHLYRRLKRRPPVKCLSLNEKWSRRVTELRDAEVAEFFKGWHFASKEQNWRYRLVFTAVHIHPNEQIDRETRFAGLDERHPFLDSRLVEFCFRVPSQQRGLGDWQKRMLRTAMTGRLAEPVRRRIIQASLGQPSSLVQPPHAPDAEQLMAPYLDQEMAEVLRAGYRADYIEAEFDESFRLWCALGLSRLISGRR